MYRFGLYVVCVLRGTAYFSRRDLVWPRARYITQPSPHLKGQICSMYVIEENRIHCYSSFVQFSVFISWCTRGKSLMIERTQSPTCRDGRDLTERSHFLFTTVRPEKYRGVDREGPRDKRKGDTTKGQKAIRPPVTWGPASN